MSSGIVICRLCAESKHKYTQVDLEFDMIKRDEVIQHLARLHTIIDFNDIKLPNTVCLDCICTLDRCYTFLDNVDSSQKVLHNLFYLRTPVLIPLSDDEIIFERAGLDDCDFVTEPESDYSNESQDAVTPNAEDDLLSLTDSVINHPDSSVCSDQPSVISTRSEIQQTYSDDISRDLVIIDQADSNDVARDLLVINEVYPDDVSGDLVINDQAYTNDTSRDHVVNNEVYPDDVSRDLVVNSQTYADDTSRDLVENNEAYPDDISGDLVINDQAYSNDTSRDLVVNNEVYPDDVSRDLVINSQTYSDDTSKDLVVNNPDSSITFEEITESRPNIETDYDSIIPAKVLDISTLEPKPSDLHIDTLSYDSSEAHSDATIELNNEEPSSIPEFEPEQATPDTNTEAAIPENVELDLDNTLDPSGSDEEPVPVSSTKSKPKAKNLKRKFVINDSDIDISNSSDDKPLKVTRSSTKARSNARSKAVSSVNGSETNESDSDSSNESDEAPDTVKKKDTVDKIPIDELDETWDSYNWLCNFCETIFPTVDELREHSMKAHSSCNPYRCKRCKLRKQCLKPFLKHLRSHMYKLKLSCFKCPDTFEDVLSVQRHSRIHFNKMNCPGCNVTFKNKKELKTHKDEYLKLKYMKRHKNPHIGEDRLTCTICDKTFNSINALRKHIPIHTGRKRDHVCEICGKKYFEKNHLTYHMETHSDDRPFKCKICNLGFQRMNVLKEHVWVHNDKPFPCGKCKKTFRLEKLLRNHQVVHSDVLPFECTFCKKCFRTKNTLQRHLLIHTGELPYSCPVCDEKFRYKSMLDVHTMKMHNLANAKPRRPLLLGSKETLKWKKQMMERKLPKRV